jgi:hypothetical protein
LPHVLLLRCYYLAILVPSTCLAFVMFCLPLLRSVALLPYLLIMLPPRLPCRANVVTPRTATAAVLTARDGTRTCTRRTTAVDARGTHAPL